MRTLSFDVDKQIIRKNENCDFSGLVPGTVGYLNAEFMFSKEWTNCKKVAVFRNTKGEYFVPLMDNSCDIPKEATTCKRFSVKVVGAKENYQITTNKIEVRQNA